MNEMVGISLVIPRFVRFASLSVASSVSAWLLGGGNNQVGLSSCVLDETYRCTLNQMNECECFGSKSGDIPFRE